MNKKSIPQSKCFHERIREFNEGSMSLLNNNENIDGYQDWKRCGGTAITAESNIMTHFHSKEKNLHNLGQWTWIRFRGQQGVHLRVISAYKPCKNRTGNHSVWTQQVNYFCKKGIQSPDPRALFDKHLIQEMKMWVEQGDTIILGIDMNGDVRKGELAMQLRRLDMQDLILHQHKSMSRPSTYNRNQNRTPIDALWGSLLLDVKRSGYRPFDQELPLAPSDGHRMIWVEVNDLSSLGKDVPHCSKVINATRLKSRNPLICNRYNKMVKKEYRK